MKKAGMTDVPGIWGGIECSINRVRNRFKDQLAYCGHYEREGDIACLADLGIEVIRYPVLWERHQPQKNQAIDWEWAGQQLETIRAYGIEPIVGLVHHGSGPGYTNLLDPDFPFLLADYAYLVARRFPWLTWYTPVNEPLTTARFSGLYGLWYPHARDERSFYKMLINQLKAVSLSMEAIRTVNPFAKLVQTEDLGKTHSTPRLAYQADFENERRLLTFDLLTGRVDPSHSQGRYLTEHGVTEEELSFFLKKPSAPDILGLNYYITSERWLDERTELYDHDKMGGNGRESYADTEVVRVNPLSRSGIKKLATEIWERYRIPLAVTEAHLHCTREDQMRWLQEVWNESVELCQEGIPVIGVTAWALLGSFDWDSLLTKTGTQYESGAFDMMAFPGELRQTAVAGLIKELADVGKGSHPVLSQRGWWHPGSLKDRIDGRPLIIVSGSNSEGNQEKIRLNTEIIQACMERRLAYVVRSTVNSPYLRKINPWAVIELDNEEEVSVWCMENNVQHVSFSGHIQGQHTLTILMDLPSASTHQINKVLDLLIDGFVGVWNFDLVES